MRTLVILMSILAGVTVTNANPVMAPPPPYVLSAENVTINVYRSESKVEGVYTLQAPQRRPARIVDIRFPVVFPTNSIVMTVYPVASSEQLKHVAQQLMDRVKPVGSADGQEFTIRTTAGETSYYNPDIQRHMPQALVCQFFTGRMPVAPGKKQVNLHLSYVQPHLPGNISAYLPILQGDIVKKNYLITFRAQEGVGFTPLGDYEIVGKASDTVLSVRPADRQLLQMQVK
jgi:hypothetical protein